MCFVNVSFYWKGLIYFGFCSALSSVTPSDCSDGDVRLVGGATEYEGRVEVCLNEVWSTVCAYSGWYSNAAKVVCNQIGALTLGLLVVAGDKIDDSHAHFYRVRVWNC